MGISRRCARSFGLVVSATLLSGAAQAAERLHMPFDCRIDGGRVHMRPTPEQRTYAIIGPRKRQVFSTCSPVDPELCRSWSVHRFAFTCEGARVTWLDAAGAAALGQGWDAWVEDGRFNMRMGRQWAVARPRPFAGRGWRRHSYPPPDGVEDFGPDGDRAAPRIVTLPPQFAPAMGIPLSFSSGADALAQEPGAAPAAVAAHRPAPESPAAVAAHQPAPESVSEPEPEPIPDLPERAPLKPSMRDTPKDAPAKVAVARDAPAKEDNDAKDTRADARATAPQKSANVTPTIINAPRSAAPAAPAPAAVTPKDAAEPAGASGTGGAGSPTAHPPETADAAAVKDATPESEPDPLETAALPAAAPPDRGTAAVQLPLAAGAAATALVLSSLTAFGFWRWKRGRVRATLPADRDIANISLDGRTPAPALALDRAPPAAAPDAGPDGFPVPSTYAEALETLGVSADATTAGIKKIVDGLRQSWHPDLARSEADRLYRERRLRQVNVAWDLVSRRRTAA